MAARPAARASISNRSSTVELNNDIVALVEREKAEIRRILLALTRAFRVRGDELVATVDVAADIDELHAKVQSGPPHGRRRACHQRAAAVEFLGARHPLLIPAVRDLPEPSGSTPAQPR